MFEFFNFITETKFELKNTQWGFSVHRDTIGWDEGNHALTRFTTGRVERKHGDWERARLSSRFYYSVWSPWIRRAFLWGRFGTPYLWELDLGAAGDLKAFGVHRRLHGNQATRSTIKLSHQLQETQGPRAGQGHISKEMFTEAPVLALAHRCLWESFLCESIRDLHISFMLHITEFSDAQIPSLTGTFVASVLTKGLKVAKHQAI